jgi:hypothetical protein
MEIIFTPYITSGCQIPFPSHAAACKCEFGTELHGFVLASSLPEACLTWHGLEGHGERERERERERESSLPQSVKILACEISHKALARLVT